MKCLMHIPKTTQGIFRRLMWTLLLFVVSFTVQFISLIHPHNSGHIHILEKAINSTLEHCNNSNDDIGYVLVNSRMTCLGVQFILVHAIAVRSGCVATETLESYALHSFLEICKSCSGTPVKRYQKAEAMFIYKIPVWRRVDAWTFELKKLWSYKLLYISSFTVPFVHNCFNHPFHCHTQGCFCQKWYRYNYQIIKNTFQYTFQWRKYYVLFHSWSK